MMMSLSLLQVKKMAWILLDHDQEYNWLHIFS